MTEHTLELPDLFTSSPLTTFEFSPAARTEAAAILAAPAEEILGRLLRDRESEPVLLAAKHLLDAFLGQVEPAEQDIDADSVAAEVRAVRDELAVAVGAFSELDPPVREAVLRERAAVGLLGGCWLDLVSQPATQPAVIVNHLFRHHVVLKGHGNPRRSLYQRRRRTLEDAGVYLPEIDAADFGRKAGLRPLTALHASWYLALSRFPASFLAEVLGVHYAFHALGLDDLLTGSAAPLPEPALREVLADYLAMTRRSAHGTTERRRLHTAVRLVLLLEREHAGLLAELATWQSTLSLDARVAMIVARHAPFAGSHHRGVRVRGKPLTQTFADPDLDLAAFVTEFRDSRQVKPLSGGGCRFINAIRFGGPMFGIFDEGEAATFKAWIDRVQAGDLAPVQIPVNRVGDDRAADWRAAISRSEPAGVVFADADPVDDREVFYRVINIEHFPNMVALARERAERGLAGGEILLVHGAGARYTDASDFDYSPAALQARVDRIYWDKLVNPYRPLTEFPSREEVVFGQMTFALANLVDGAWAHRLGNIGRFQRDSDGMLFSIYADEVGAGDLRKNHITLIYQVLRSLEVPVPHIRSAAFQDQEYMPDGTYDFAIHQVCMSLFPDSLYNELLGYTLGVEMYGLGEVRLHEIEKLRRYGFDTSYDDVHLSIDSVSGGHSRLAIDAIVSHLDLVERMLGPSAVLQEWRRIWRGYASFAFYADHQYVGTLLGGAADDHVELVI